MRNKIYLLIAVLSVACMFFQGCGGGSSDTASLPTRVTIKFKAMSTLLPVRINSMEISTTLPQNLQITTNAGTSQVSSDKLSAGAKVVEGVGTSHNIFARYSSNKLKITILDTSSTQSGFGSGDFVSLLCSINPTTTITETELLASFSTLSIKAYGFNSETHNTVDLSSLLSLSVDPKF